MYTTSQRQTECRLTIRRYFGSRDEEAVSETITGGSAAIAGLEAAGVDVVFGIPGVHTLSLYDALHGSSIRHILARHEQGAGFMADGYARATGRAGVCLIITGPGITNVATPVGEAYADSVPVVIISSQLERAYRNEMRGNLHDISDQSGLMSVLTKQSTSVDQADQVAQAVFDAVRTATSGRPRPVHVEIPLDVLAEQTQQIEPAISAGTPSSPVASQIEQAADMLKQSTSPIIYVGGGAQDAAEAVTELAGILGAPVLSSIMGKGVVSDRHPLALGHAWDPWGRENPVDELLHAADLAIVIGSKLGAQETNYWQMPLPSRIIRIDIDERELALNYGAPALAIQADANLTVSALNQLLLKGTTVANAASAERVATVKEKNDWIETDELTGRYIQALRAALPDDGIIVQDMTMMSYRMNDQFPVYRPRTYLFPSSYGTLGYAMPAAIGAKIGRPDTPVIAIAVDGGYQFTMQELATAVQFNLSLPVVIFNDSTYTAVKGAMEWEYEGRTMAVDLVNPDYVRLAAAYGIDGVRTSDPAELGDAVTTAFQYDRPTLIDVPLPG